MTAAQKKQLETYQPGLAVRFEKDYRSLGVRRGETAQVERVFADAMIVSLPDGTHRTMSPRRLSGKGWSLGVVEDLEVAAGERVRFTGTNSSAGYRNREHGVVEEISADALAIRRSDGSTVRLARDRVLSLDYRYAVTGHSAQGLDASRVVMEKDTHSRTTDRRSFYTDLTRARDAAIVVTDSSGSASGTRTRRPPEGGSPGGSRIARAGHRKRSGVRRQMRQLTGDLNIRSSPTLAANALELGDAKRSALVTRLRSRRLECGQNNIPVRLEYFGSLEIRVQKNQQHRIEVFTDIDRPEALSRLAAGKQAAALNLVAPSGAELDGVITGVAGGRELDAENASRFVLRNLTGNTKRPASQCAVFLGQLLSLRQDSEDAPAIFRLSATVLFPIRRFESETSSVFGYGPFNRVGDPIRKLRGNLHDELYSRVRVRSKDSHNLVGKLDETHLGSCRRNVGCCMERLGPRRLCRPRWVGAGIVRWVGAAPAAPGMSQASLAVAAKPLRTFSPPPVRSEAACRRTTSRSPNWNPSNLSPV